MLGILGAVQQQLGGNVRECDPAVGEADRPHLEINKCAKSSSEHFIPFHLDLSSLLDNYRSLDDVVVKPHNEAVGEVGLELGGELLHHAIEPGFIGLEFKSQISIRKVFQRNVNEQVRPSHVACFHSLCELQVGSQRMLDLEDYSS